MKYFILLPCLMAISSNVATAQHIDIEAGAAPAHHPLYEYPLRGAQFTVEEQFVRLIGPDTSVTVPGLQALDRSSRGEYLQILYRENELISELFDSDGNSIYRRPLEHFDPDDDTIDIRLFGDGRFITRDNVANFTFFGPDGSAQYQISNSTQNPDGESVSELAADPAGRTIVLYNPRINYGSDPGSRARLVFEEDEMTELISSRDRSISTLAIPSSGSYILIVTHQAGSGDLLYLFDRFGNLLADHELDETLTGADVTEDGQYITVWFGNRIQVYQTRDMERIGSVTLQSTIMAATYYASDHQVVALGGTAGSDRTISGPGIFSVHLGERQIASSEVNAALTFLSREDIRIERIGSGSYQLRGLNRPIEFRTRF